jgi:hypothetical protein
MEFLPDAPFCCEDFRLLEEFACATEEYFDAVKNLQNSQSETGIFHAFESAEKARRDCVSAREAVQRHRQEHGCRAFGLAAKA